MPTRPGCATSSARQPQLWHVRGRPAELLWTGTPYREFTVWRESYPGGLTTTEEAFADAMIGHAGRRRRRRRLVAAAVLLAAVAVAAVTTALWRRSEHHARRLEARRLTEIARQEHGWHTADRARLRRGQPRAHGRPESGGSPCRRSRARRCRWLIGEDQPPHLAVGRRLQSGWAVAFGGSLRRASRTVAGIGRPANRLAAHEGMARGYFTPDSKALKSLASADPRIILWSVPEHRQLGTAADDRSLTSRHGRANGNIWRNCGGWSADPSLAGRMAR